MFSIPCHRPTQLADSEVWKSRSHIPCSLESFQSISIDVRRHILEDVIVPICPSLVLTVPISCTMPNLPSIVMQGESGM